VSDFGPSHIINIKKEKRETDEETKQILRMLQKDDFLDDPGLKNDVRNKPVQLPLAENRMAGAVSLLEGWAVGDGEFLRRPEISANVQAAALGEGLGFEFITAIGCGRKSVEIYPDRILWSYELHAADPEARVFHTIPIVVYDGKNTLAVRRTDDSTLELGFAGCAFRLSCSGAVRVALSQQRSLDSVSGLASEVLCEIAPGVEPGVFRWKTELKLLSQAAS